ncbi:MAG: hypothetical protein WC616_01415 [Candidatus Omnitrophota bacterium]
MRNILSKLKISGEDFSIIQWDRCEKDRVQYSGQLPYVCNYGSKEIWIASDVSSQGQEEAMLLATIETISEINKLRLTQHQICVLGKNIFQSMIDGIGEKALNTERDDVVNNEEIVENNIS